jgi:hypothetical protein
LEHTLTGINKEILVTDAAMFALNGFEAQLAAARAERRSEEARLERMKDQLQKKMRAGSLQREDPQAPRVNSNQGLSSLALDH